MCRTGSGIILIYQLDSTKISRKMDVYIFIKSTSREFRTVKVIAKFRFSLSLIAIKDVILLFQIDDIGLS